MDDNQVDLASTLAQHTKALLDLDVFVRNHMQYHHRQDELIRRLDETVQRLTVATNEMKLVSTADSRERQQLGEAVTKLTRKLLDDPNGGSFTTRVKRLEDRNTEEAEDLKERMGARRAAGWRLAVVVVAATVLGIASTVMGWINVDINRRLVDAVRATQPTRTEVEIRPQATMSREQMIEAIREIIGSDTAPSPTPSRSRSPQKARGGKPLSQKVDQIAPFGIPDDWVVYP